MQHLCSQPGRLLVYPAPLLPFSPSFLSFSCCLFCTQRLSHHMENTHICTNTANLTPLCSQATRAAVCVCVSPHYPSSPLSCTAWLPFYENVKVSKSLELRWECLTVHKRSTLDLHKYFLRPAGGGRVWQQGRRVRRGEVVHVCWCVCVSEALEKLKLCDVHQNAKSQTNLRCGSDAAERA